MWAPRWNKFSETKCLLSEVKVESWLASHWNSETREILIFQSGPMAITGNCGPLHLMKHVAESMWTWPGKSGCMPTFCQWNINTNQSCKSFQHKHLLSYKCSLSLMFNICNFWEGQRLLKNQEHPCIIFCSWELKFLILTE